MKAIEDHRKNLKYGTDESSFLNSRHNLCQHHVSIDAISFRASSALIFSGTKSKQKCGNYQLADDHLTA